MMAFIDQLMFEIEIEMKNYFQNDEIPKNIVRWKMRSNQKHSATKSTKPPKALSHQMHSATKSTHRAL